MESCVFWTLVEILWVLNLGFSLELILTLGLNEIELKTLAWLI